MSDAVPVMDGSVPDATMSSDASTDGSPTVDGPPGTDAATDAFVDAPVTFCNGNAHTFCADFDSVAKISDGWDMLDVRHGGMFNLQTSSFASSPRSAFASVPMLPTGTNYPVAMLKKTLPTSKRTVRIQWAMRHFIGSTAIGNLQLFGVDLNGVSFVGVDVTSTGWYVFVRAGGTGGMNYTSLPVPAGAWTNLQLVVVFASGNQGSVFLSANADGGSMKLFEQQAFETSTESAVQSVGISAGLGQFTSPGAAFDVSYDNITVDLQ